jgi:hypothetical protein
MEETHQHDPSARCPHGQFPFAPGTIFIFMPEVILRLAMAAGGTLI